MIDTDKYEGHTEGVWYWDGNLCNDYWNGKLRDDGSDKHGIATRVVLDWELGVGDVDKQLIADAPLLLREVKRLREKNKVLAEYRDIVRMTDTDNFNFRNWNTRLYEGHLASEGPTKWPWTWSTWMRENRETFEQHRITATAALLDDAPRLLKRVIHLEHILKCARDVLKNIYTYDKDLEDAEWIAWFCDMEDEEE
jgi:hypothetical protein